MMPVFVASLKKHAVGMAVIFFLIAATVAAVALLRSSLFEAHARIHIPEIKIGESQEKQAEEGTSPPPSPAAAEQKALTLQTAIEILRGNVLAKQVMTTIGITQLFPDLEQNTQGEDELLSHALATFQQQLTVIPIKETRIIKITFQHPEAALAARVVETLLQLFQKEYKKFQSHEEALQNEQLLLSRQEMHQAARTLSMFQQRHQLLLVGEAPDKITEQYDKMTTLLSTEQANLHEHLNQLKRLEEQFAETLKPENSEQVQQEEFNEERKDLIRLKLYEQELREKYGEGGSGDQLIANVRLQIASLKKLLYSTASVPEAEQREAETVAEQLVLAKIASRKQQEKTELVQRRIRQLENKLQSTTEQGDILGELRQQAEATRKRYATLVQQLETEQNFRKRSEQIRVIEKPVLPPTPIKPRKKSALLLALASGLIGSLLYGMLQMPWKGAHPHVD